MLNNQISPSDATLSLNGAWQFRQSGHKQWLSAQVPGCNFTDLLDNNLIEDPFFGEHEHQLQWIEHQDWQYRKSFEISKPLMDYSDLELVFGGLDTYCDVYLNDQLIHTNNNMFVGARIACKQHLRLGANELLILFRSPINETLPIFKANGFTYPAENDKSVERLSVFTRKAPYHYGWDWGPRFVTSGIWRSVTLQAFNRLRIADTHVKQLSVNDQHAELCFDITLDRPSDFNGTVRVHCTNVTGLSSEVAVNNCAATKNMQLTLNIDNPQRWWPNGLGEAFLYQFSIELIKNDQLLTSDSVTIGLRTIEVVNEPDEFGESFYLKVNGHPTFMKGANYIPSDSFLNRVSESKYKKIFSDAVSANMNMLRVWGGGIYEDDQFYRLADEHGILIWQDFMFACSLYPADRDFIDNVKQEVEHNIKRLRNHACIALWCGNNETEMGIEFWHWPTTFNYSDSRYQQLQQDYSLLFKQILPQLVTTFDPSRFYFSSSPIGFWERKEDDNLGDNHYWGVWHGEEPFSEFRQRVPRFMSEYGFQSFPIFDSVKQYSTAPDWHIDSPVMKTHQKHPRGNSLIKQYMQSEYREAKDFESFLYLSQVQQALGMKIAFEAHRVAMPFCMGTLYWQFNDCWPVASWSGIDYYGRWKAMHYQAQRCFKPVAVFIEQVDQRLKISVISDLLTITHCQLELTMLSLDGQVLYSQQLALELAANTSVLVAELDSEKLLDGHSRNEVVFVAQLVAPEHDSEALHYLVPSKDLALQQVNFTVDKNHTDQQINLSLTADSLARQVYIRLPDSTENFSDNFFDLLPGMTKQLSLSVAGKSEQEVAQMLQQLTIMSLVDTYQATPVQRTLQED